MLKKVSHLKNLVNNSIEDLITIVHNIAGIRVKCNQCGTKTQDDIDFWESEFEFNTQESDGLMPINKALSKLYKVTKHKYKGHGQIEETQ